MVDLNFNIGDMIHIEFGVGRDIENGQEFSIVPIGDNAKQRLQDMAINTWKDMQKSVEGSPTQMELPFEQPVNDKIDSFAISSDHQKMQKRLDGWTIIIRSI